MSTIDLKMPLFAIVDSIFSFFFEGSEKSLIVIRKALRGEEGADEM